jgi:hypothetical protein
VFSLFWGVLGNFVRKIVKEKLISLVLYASVEDADTWEGLQSTLDAIDIGFLVGYTVVNMRCMILC